MLVTQEFAVFFHLLSCCASSLCSCRSQGQGRRMRVRDERSLLLTNLLLSMFIFACTCTHFTQQISPHQKLTASQSSCKRTSLGSRESAHNWSWLLTGMILIREEFKQGLVKAAITRAVCSNKSVRLESFDCIPLWDSLSPLLLLLPHQKLSSRKRHYPLLELCAKI